MIQKSKFFIKSKQNWLGLLLVISAVCMCIVHAIPAGIYADFIALNGDFQNYNVVRRFLDGQLAYHDYTAYLGYGHVFFGSILTFLFGAGNPILISSKMAFQFASTFSFAIWTYAIFSAIFYRHSKLTPIIFVNIFLLLLLINPSIFVNTLSFSNDFYSAMQYALSTGNSARFLRGIAPVLLVALVFFFAFLKQKIKLLDRSLNLSIAFVFGIPTGIIFYHSNDYGIASAVSAFVMILIIIAFDKTKLSEKAKIFFSFLATAAASFIVFGTIITGGHFGEYLSATFGTGGAQNWYYYTRTKSYYLWDIDLSFWVCVQAVVTLAYLVMLILKGFSKRNMIRYGIPMFFNMAAYAATNEYKLLSSGSAGLHEVSYTILYLTLCAEGLLFLSKLIKQLWVFSPAVKRMFACATAIISLVWSFSSYVPLQINSFSDDHGIFVDELGYFQESWLASSVQATGEFVKEGDVIFSTYASAVEAYHNQFQPSGTDYIIHALGNSARTKYIDTFIESDPDYATTLRETYSDYEYWIKNVNWFFYRELYQNYVPVYATDYQLFWSKKELTDAYDSTQVQLSINSIDPKNIEIIVQAPGIKFGQADVALSYAVQKTSSFRSLFTYNTMVSAINDSGFSLSGNERDKYYNLAGTGDGTPNSSIGIPIVNGFGRVVLTSQPEQNTTFEYFNAAIQGVYDSGYFESVVVTETKQSDEQYQLTIQNTPENRLIINGASAIKIGEKEYPAQFAVTDDNYINITTQSLDASAVETLTGHQYYPVIQIA